MQHNGEQFLIYFFLLICPFTSAICWSSGQVVICRKSQILFILRYLSTPLHTGELCMKCIYYQNGGDNSDSGNGSKDEYSAKT